MSSNNLVVSLPKTIIKLATRIQEPVLYSVMESLVSSDILSSNGKMFHVDIETVEEFLQRFKVQNYDALRKVSKDESRSAMLLANALPVHVLTDMQRRLQPLLLTECTFEKLEAQLLISYGVKKSVVAASVTFHTRKQKSTESIESYAKALNSLASQCEYEKCCRDKLVRNVFISGLRSSKLVKTLIVDASELSFAECVERAKIHEQISNDVDKMTPPENIQNAYRVQASS